MDYIRKLRTMKLRSTFLMTCFLTILNCSREVPVDVDGNATSISTEPEMTYSNGASRDRWNDSRMLDMANVQTTTVQGYDDWWFLTTSRRPFVSYRDFPGRPGVATWKEISPVSGDNRKSRKISKPTAASVSTSGASAVELSLSLIMFLPTLNLLLLVLQHGFLFTLDVKSKHVCTCDKASR